MHTYLAATLPVCTLGQTPPLTLDQLYTQCAGILKADALQDLKLLLSGRLIEGRTAFGRAWSALSRQMDNEMAALRAQRWQIQPPPPKLHSGFSLEASRLVHEAFSRETPLEMEWALDQGRWKLAQGLISPDRPLGVERILAFGLQLGLMHRWADMDADVGRKQLSDLIEATVQNHLSKESMKHHE